MITTPIVRPVLTERVTANGEQSLSFNGVVRSSSQVALSFQVAGKLTKLLVKEGEAVKEGQLLASIDDRDFQSSYTAAKVELLNARVEFERGQTVFENSKAITKSMLDVLQTQYQIAQTRYDEAKRKLEYTQITAPFSGVISRKIVDNYVQVQANEPILSLHDVDDLEVVIHISDRVMLTQTHQKKALAEISTLNGRLFPLTLKAYSTQADPVTQTYAITLRFDDISDVNILPGMAVKVYAAKSEDQMSSPVISVPLVAVVPNNQGKQFVWIVDKNNETHKRYVTVGALNRDSVEIIEGLNSGETIVVAGVSSIQTGMVVRPYQDDIQTASGGQ
nr:efflux RND transporter periplasmic adaptor subunit [Vibrio amylolyticus]